MVMGESEQHMSMGRGLLGAWCFVARAIADLLVSVVHLVLVCALGLSETD